MTWNRIWEGGVGVMSVCVVSLDYLCRWQFHVSEYCAPYRYLLPNVN